jgi:anti-anti-sigma factor
MIVETSRSGGVMIIAISGRVDSTTAPKLQTIVEGVIKESARRMAFDLSAMDFISSAGLRILLMAVKQMKTLNGQVAFAGPTPGVMSLLKMSGFLSLMVVKPSLAEAVAAV